MSLILSSLWIGLTDALTEALVEAIVSGDNLIEINFWIFPFVFFVYFSKYIFMIFNKNNS